MRKKLQCWVVGYLLINDAWGKGKAEEVKNEKEYKRREKEDKVQDIMCMSRVTDPFSRRPG